MKRNKFFVAIKDHFADHGLFGGIFIGFFLILSFVVFFPFILFDCLNEGSKRWFGGDPDA